MGCPYAAWARHAAAAGEGSAGRVHGRRVAAYRELEQRKGRVEGPLQGLLQPWCHRQHAWSHCTK